MTRELKNFLAIAACVISPAALSSQAIAPQNGAEAAYIQYVAAWKAKDLETLKRVIADDYFALNGEGKMGSKTTELAEAKADGEYSRMEVTEVHSKLIGTTGIVSGILVVSGMNNGKPYTAHSRFLATLIERNHQWQLVADESAPAS